MLKRISIKVHSNTVYDICRLQTADRRPQTADCRLQTAGCRLQTADIFVQSYIGLIPKMLLAILHRPFIISPGISLIALILHSSLIIVN